MKSFRNVRISRKLLVSYIIISLIAGGMGMYAIYSIKSLSHSNEILYNDVTSPLADVSEVLAQVHLIKNDLREMTASADASVIAEKEASIREKIETISLISDNLKKTINTQALEEAYGNYDAVKLSYIAAVNEAIDLVKQNKDSHSIICVGGKVEIENDNLHNSVNKIIEIKVTEGGGEFNKSIFNSNVATGVMLFLTIVVIAFSITIGLFISSIITKPLKKTVSMIDEMSKGHFDKRLNFKTKDEIGTMARSMDKFADQLQNEVIKAMDMIAVGDVSFDVDIKDDKDEISPAIKRTLQTVRGINQEVQRLIHATLEGDLSVRGECVHCQGAWKELIQGINALINAFAAPIHITSNYIERISNGDIPEKITEEYKGDLNEIKTSINCCIDIMNGLLQETKHLINCAKTGQLDCKADVTRFNGSWSELVIGVNSLLETVAVPIREVTAVMEEVANGNLSVKVQGNYKGLFDNLSKSVNITTRDLHTVVEEISQVIEEICNGNLAISNVDDYRGDFRTISNSINQILDSLNLVLGDINSSSERVSRGSIQVSSGSQSLSQGASEQASALEQLTTSVSDISEKTFKNAGYAAKANEITISVKGMAETGNKEMQNMLDSMAEINESSNNISKVIKTIDDIAFQTNILALNAAVEAARAGQHGKGFAVVAEEVRNLAERSAKAAKETTSLIQGSIGKAANGSEIADKTAKSLNEIVSGVAEAADFISQIATSSNEQATGIGQINIGLEQVSKVVQTNAATAEESAASSAELSEQAAHLKEMVGRFELRK